MAHFMFYAGRAYDYKQQKKSAQRAIDEIKKAGGFATQGISTSLIAQSNMDPVGEAIQDGNYQEMSDRIFSSHSAYSYEDLPSNKFGAEFGVNYFDNVLKATTPENAPNYKKLPNKDERKPPSRTNHTTKPVYTKDNP